MHKFFENK